MLRGGGGSLAYPGETITTQGIWYDLGNVGQGFDNDGDLVPDKNAWMQPVGDPSTYDAGCFRLIRTYGLVIVKLKGGGEHLIPFENQLYFEQIPANTGAVGLVFYEFAALNGACKTGISPYQEVASGFDNEKFSGDYGVSIPFLQSLQSEVSIIKTVDQSSLTSAGGTLQYTVDFNNTGTVDAGDPSLGLPLVIQEEIPAGTAYIANSASISLSATVLYSTDNGTSWVAIEPAAALVTNIQWWLDAPLAASTSGTVSFQASVPNSFADSLVANTAGLSIGSAAPFAEDDAVTLISGTNSIGDTVFTDDGVGGGIASNGIQDGTEVGIADIKVSLYYDVNGDGKQDIDDILWGEQDTNGSGQYTFANLPNGKFIAVVDRADADLTVGAGLTTSAFYAVELIGANFLAADFGFAASLSVDKTLTSANPVYAGAAVSYTIDVKNLLPAEPAQSCTYTTWASNATSGDWNNPANAGNAFGPDSAFADTTFNHGNSWKPLSADTWDVGNQQGSITKVEALFNVQIDATLTNDEFETRLFIDGVDTTSSNTFTTTQLNNLVGSSGELVWDVTSFRPWAFSDFPNVAASGAGFEVDTSQNSGPDNKTIRVDAIGFRITTSDTCSSTTLVTVPLTDVYDSTKLEYVSADVVPTTVTSGLLSWTNIGSIAANDTKTITVNFKALSPGISPVDTTNTATVNNALFFDGSSANDDTDSADVTINPTGAIGDTIFWDANGNGQQDLNETGVSGVTVTLTPVNPAGSTDTTTTDSNGKYLFSGLLPGDYKVTVDTAGPLNGRALTADPDADGVLCSDASVTAVCDSEYTTTLAAGTRFMGADFGYQPPGVIGDTVWIDANNNGVRDDGEYGLGFVIVTLSGAASKTTETDSDGYYSFDNLADGDYTVQVTTGLPVGLAASYDRDSTLDNQTPVTITAGNSVLDADFGYRYTGANNLSGTICLDDISENGVCGTGDSDVEASETALSGTTVYLYLWNDDGDNTVEAGETSPVASALTNSQGDYSFVNIPNGDFVVSVAAPLTNLALTTAVADTPATILVKNPSSGDNISAYQGIEAVTGSSSVTGVDFAYKLTLAYDFGDLPAPYTSKMIAGARHFMPATANLYLGSSIDAELNATPSINATGDGVDEDGVTFTSMAEGVNGGNISVVVNGTGYLIGWIDFDGDGFFTGTSEMIVNQAVTSGTSAITFDIPIGGLQQNRYAHFRLFSQAPPVPSLAFNGSADNGEVEDYLIQVLNEGVISDRAWFDSNQDGVQDPSEMGVAGVTVNLLNAAGTTTLKTTITDGTGAYAFTGLMAADYQVEFVKPANYSFSPKNSATGTFADSFDSDADTTTGRALVTLVNDSDVQTTIDAGMYLTNDDAPSSISDRVWYDTNNNGVQDGSEPGIAGVLVELRNSSNVVIADILTDGNGLYEFSGLAAADYTIKFILPSGYSFSPFAQGGDNLLDSDADVITGITATISLAAGTIVTDIDAGMRVPGEAPASIGDFVWYDTNDNGVQDVGEPGIAGQQVRLYDASDLTTILATTTTDSVGNYQFNGLAAGNYVVEFSLPLNHVFSFKNQGSDPDKSSDADEITGQVAITLAAGQIVTTIDAGMSVPGSAPISIADQVWLDGDASNGFNSGEGLANVNVYLYDASGNLLDTKVTNNADGNYSFATIPVGDYRVVVDTSTLPTGAIQIADPDATLDSATDLVNLSADTDAVDFGYQAGIIASPALTIVKTANPSTYSGVGNVINYSFVVTNSGNVSLAGPVSLSDDKTTDESCPAVSTVGNNDANLDPNESITCTASYTIVQTDINAGSVVNVATASADGTTSPSDTETVTANQGPALTIVKTANPGTYSSVGNVISYSFLVTNSGNVSLAGPVSVSDDKTTNESCPVVSTVGNNDTNLDPGESLTCTASYSITQADINAGTVTNVATASADGTTSPSDTETVTASLRPALTIVKTANPGTYSSVGNVISYSFLVTNSGNVSLAGPVSVSDDKTTNESCPVVSTVGNNDTNLDPGESLTCTASYSITQADINAGTVTNVATASADGTTSPSDTETVTASLGPALTIVKTANPGTYSSVGNVISYSFLVTNSGNVSLAGPVSVSDDKTTNESCPVVSTISNNDTNLDPGESLTCTASYSITQADINAGTVTNVATASADGTTSPSDTETVNAASSSNIALEKEGVLNDGGNGADVGDTISYTFKVTNTGNTTLTAISVTDPKVTVSGGPLATLAPGASDIATFTATYTLTQTDIDAGTFVNQATVTGKDPQNKDVTDISDDPGDVTSSDDPTVTPLAVNGKIALEKVGTLNDGGDGADVDDIINYAFKVTNTGQTTLTAINVSDPKVTVVGGPLALLLPGASDIATFTASYTLTQADIDAGVFVNQATVTGKDPQGQDVTDISDDPADVTSSDDPTVNILVPGVVAQITGIVFIDTIDNDIKDLGEDGVGGWIIQLINSVTGLTVELQTQADGTFSQSLAPGNYTVRILSPGGLIAQEQQTTLVSGFPVFVPQPIDPSGVIYDEVTGDPIPDAQVFLTTNGALLPAVCLGAGEQGQVTGVNGAYIFFLSPGAGLACPVTDTVYSIQVIPPTNFQTSVDNPPQAGVLDADNCTIDAVAGVTCEVSDQTVAPIAGIPPYFIEVEIGVGDPGVFNNHIPLTPPSVVLPPTPSTPVKPIPTLSEWGRIILILFIGMAVLMQQGWRRKEVAKF